MLLEVTVSGTVGKQTIPVTQKAKLKRVIATVSAANLTIKIRDGNASGETVFYGKIMSASTEKTQSWPACHYFTKGMHVKVIGTNNVAYLELE